MGDAQAFRQDWEANGPMAPGLDPMDAVDRLKKFQQMFEVSPAAPSGSACCCRKVVCFGVPYVQQQVRVAVGLWWPTGRELPLGLAHRWQHCLARLRW